MKAVVRVDCLPREQRTAIRRACRDEIINHRRFIEEFETIRTRTLNTAYC